MNVINFPSADKLILLAIIALIVLGPTRLPGAARTAGRWVGELRKLSSRFQDELHGALGDHKDELTTAVGTFRNEVGSLRNELHGMVLGSGSTPLPPDPAATPTPNGTVPGSSEPWAQSVSSGVIASGVTPPGLPVLPAVPDDPSLN